MASWLADILQQVNSEAGWGERYAVPELDAEEKALIQEIQEKEKLLAEVEKTLESNKDQRQIQAKQTKSLDRELENIEALIKVKDREIDMVNNLTALAERQRGVVSARTARMMTDIASLAQRKENIEDSIFKTNLGLEEFREKMNWDQQTMDDFMKESALQNEERMAIMKYSHKDDKKVKSLTLAIEKMTLEVKEKHKALDKEITETKSTQIALDKTTENLQKVYQVTQQLTQQWENALKQVKQRDDEMHQCALQIAQANENYREKTATLTERKQLLDTQRNNNKELKQKIYVAKREAVKLRQNQKEEESNCRRLQDEVDACKGVLDKTTTNVGTLRSDISKMKKDIQENNHKLKEAEDFNAALEEKLRAVTQTALSEEERAAQMEQFLKDEERALKELDVQLNDNSQELLVAQHHLDTMRKKRQESVMQISNSKVMLTNLKREMVKQKKNLGRQWKIMTAQSMQVNRLKDKLERLQGKLPSDETQVLEEKISELTKTLEEKRKMADTLTSALKESERSVRCLRQELEKSEAQKRDLSASVSAATLLSSSKEKELKRLTLKKQENMVEHQILKAEVKRLSALLNNKEDSMLSSEKRKLELQKALKERECDISLQRDTLSRQLHLSDQERHKLRIQLSEKLRKVEILKNRYESMTKSMLVPESEGENAQAYIILKAAQESEELRRSRDSLAAKIQKVECENAALDNSNMLFNHHNSSLRKCLQKVDKSSPEYQEKLRLEEQLKATQETLKYQKKQVKELQQDLQNKYSTLESLLQEEKAEKDKQQYKQQLISQLDKDISSQQEKLDRATKQCSKLIKQIRSAKNSKGETLEEKHIKLRELKEVSKNFYKMLHKAMENDPDLRPVLEKYFQQAQLPIPAPLSSPSSCRSSTQSSAGSLASFRSGASTARSASSSRASAGQTSTLKVVELALAVPPTSPSSKSSGSASGRSSSSSSNSSKKSKRL